MLVLLALLGTALADSPRLSDPVRPTSLGVALRVDPAGDTVDGHVSIGLDVGAKARSVTLHADELTLTSATFMWGGRVMVPAAITMLEGGRVQLDPVRPLRRGSWSLEIDYQGSVHEQPYGLYRFEHDGAPYLVTQLEADDARTVWPCFDEPGFKVPHQLTVTAPSELLVVTNTPESSSVTTDGFTTHVFEATPPIPTYAAALAVGPYDTVAVDGVGVPARVVVPQGLTGTVDALVAELPGVMAAAQSWFGTPYPYAKLDMVVVPSFAFGAMENPGAIVMNGSLVPEPGRETPRTLHRLTMVTAHEVAHMWFGNLVTMAWWDDFWLNESFANWMGEKLARRLHPELRRELDAPGSLARMLRVDATATARPLRTDVDPGAIFETANFAVYDKGEALLDHMAAWMGGDVFQAGVRAYLARHREGNATAADLFAALEEASGLPVGDTLRPFLDRPGAPRITLTRVDDDTWHVEQSRLSLLGVNHEPVAPWPVVAHLRVGKADGTTEVVDVALAAAAGPQAVSLPGALWVHPAADGIGYYAWSLAEADRARLLDHVDALGPRERLSLFEQAYLEVATGQRTPADLLPLIARFSAETDPVVLSEVAGLAGYMRVVDTLDPPEPALEAQAHAWVREVVRPMLDRVGMEPVAGEGSDLASLRVDLLGLLGWAEDPDVVAMARRIAGEHLMDPATGDPQIVPWALGVWVEDAPLSAHPRLLVLADEATTPGERARFLGLAAALRHPEARADALGRALDPALPMRDTFALLGGVDSASSDDHALQDDLLTWQMDHHDELAAKLPPQFRMYLAGVSSRDCRIELLERSEAFYLDPERVVPGTERVIGESQARMTQCITQRDARAPSVRAFLSAWSASR